MVKHLISSLPGALRTGRTALEAVQTGTRDALEHASDAVAVGYASVRNAADSMTTLGLVVAGLVAPVPTLVGLAMVEIMADSIASARKSRQDRKRQLEREHILNRYLEVLKAHGTLPASAIMETAHIRVVLNSQANQATGAIKRPWTGWWNLEQLSDEQIRATVRHADDETQRIAEAWLSIQAAWRKHYLGE